MTDDVRKVWYETKMFVAVLNGEYVEANVRRRLHFLEERENVFDVICDSSMELPDFIDNIVDKAHDNVVERALNEFHKLIPPTKQKETTVKEQQKTAINNLISTLNPEDAALVKDLVTENERLWEVVNGVSQWAKEYAKEQ